MPKRNNIYSELLGYLSKHKAYWLIPIIVIALGFATLITLATLSPAAAPFIYTLF